MKIIKKMSVNNECYKYNTNATDSRYVNFQKNGPKGLMLHSVGCAQSKASVFSSLWNNYNPGGRQIAVHAVLQADGEVHQCLPWNYRGWHAGGSANNTHIGVEMTEPDCIKYTGGATFSCSNKTEARKQVEGTYKTAVELFAYLCKQYKLDPLKDGVIISHAEGHKRGVASGHSDPTHLWSQLGMSYTMDGFRKDVKAAMGQTSTTTTAKPTTTKPTTTTKPATTTSSSVNFKVGDEVKLISGATYTSGKSVPKWLIGHKLYVRKISNNNITVSTLKIGLVTGVVDKKYLVKFSAFKSYKVKVVTDALNIRAGAGTNYKINGVITNRGVYTIVAEQNGWGKLKSGAGWISLDYVTKV